MEQSRGSAGFGVVSWSASRAEISGGLRPPGVALPLQRACPRSCRSDRRVSGPDELSGRSPWEAV